MINGQNICKYSSVAEVSICYLFVCCFFTREMVFSKERNTSVWVGRATCMYSYISYGIAAHSRGDFLIRRDYSFIGENIFVTLLKLHSPFILKSPTISFLNSFKSAGWKPSLLYLVGEKTPMLHRGADMKQTDQTPSLCILYYFNQSE